MTVQAVGDAAQEMIAFIVKDYRETEKAAAEGRTRDPDYAGCIRISTEASLRKMIAPGALVLGAPLVAGFVFGPPAVAGLLAGAIVSGVQVAISASNSGGAWDNAKKTTEKLRSEIRAELAQNGHDEKALREELAGYAPNSAEERPEKIRAILERSDNIREKHIAAVVGDTVGDPLKDTSGPAINILIKLSAITSLVFGSYLQAYHIFDVGTMSPAEPPKVENA